MIKETPYGQVRVVTEAEVFTQTIQFIEQALQANDAATIPVALTGGSTPKAFYAWAQEQNALTAEMKQRVLWTTSDERCVPLSSDESNFGNADRGMLVPLGIAEELKFPWPVDLDPTEAAAAYTEAWNTRYSAEKAYPLCILGMGDDCHTASLFPQSPLLSSDPKENYATVVVPGKGPRLTITLSGLKRCDQIVVAALGKGKTEAIRRVFTGDYQPLEKPIQNLKQCASKVVWLLDEAAAEGLE